MQVRIQMHKYFFLIIFLITSISGCSDESSQDTIKFTIYSQGGDHQTFSGNFQINGGSPNTYNSTANSGTTVSYYEKEISSDDYSENKFETLDISATLSTTTMTNYPTMSIRVYRIDKSDNIKKVKELSTSGQTQVSLSYKYDEENSSSSSDSSSSKSSSSSSSE